MKKEVTEDENSSRYKWRKSDKDDEQEDYTKLREYVRLYKMRLYLVPKHQIFNEQKEETGLDFHTYSDLKKRHGDENVLEVVKEHQKESEELYNEVLEHSRNQHFQTKTRIFKSRHQLWSSLQYPSKESLS